MMSQLHPRQFAITTMLSAIMVHVLCCGVPLLANVAAGSVILGINGADLLNLTWLEQYEMAFFIFSTVIFSVTCILHVISKRVNCRDDGACYHTPCGEKKRLSFNVFYVITALYLINAGMFAFGHNIH